MESALENVINNVAEVELIYKSNVKASSRPQIKTSREAYEIFQKLWDQDKIGYVEQFNVLFLNNCHRVLGIYLVSTGGMTGTIVDPKLIFTAALKIGATSMVAAHNHPSGSRHVSQSDKDLTQKLKNAGAFLDIKLLDHLIILDNGYLSFSDDCLL